MKGYKKITELPKKGTEVFIIMDKKPERMVYRNIIDASVLRKNNIGWGKPETPQSYESYKSDMRWYAKNGHMYEKK